MNNFKLLAIRPLKNCNPEYLKVLKEGETYQFHNNYFFEQDDTNDALSPIVRIDRTESSVDLFSKEKLTIEISAIVGKNGSGKSSILELFYLAIYNIGCKEKLLLTPKETWKTEKTKEFYSEIDLYLEIFFTNGEKLSRITFEGKSVYLFTGDFIDNSITLEPKNDSELWKPDHDLNEFFYSIAINYSIYGLNDKHLGKWITPLFHKNDGYQTPLVINPMRHGGQFSISREDHLLKSRLLSNVLDDQTLAVVSKKKAVKLKIKLNNDLHLRDVKNDVIDLTKVQFSGSTSDNALTSDFEEFQDNLGQVFEIDWTLIDLSNLMNRVSLEYIFYKKERILSKYPEYTASNDIDYLTTLRDDSSHVTFKIKQAINFLCLDHFKTIKNQILTDQNFIVNDQLNIPASEFKVEVAIPASDLQNDLKQYITPERSLIHLLPPPFLLTDVTFSDNPKDSLNQLSSGESQYVHGIHTVIYHLRNIDSVNNRIKPVKYGNVNIFLDEVELYFHPEMQRNYINDLLQLIKSKEFSNLSGVNILFSTHSPFILSDIPSENILRISEGNKQSRPSATFGANIYQLLMDNFFMEGMIGEHAKEKISTYISELKKMLQEKKQNRLSKTQIDSRLKQIGGIEFINLIGDTILRDKLLQLYFMVAETDDKKALKKYYQAKLKELNN